MSYSSSRRRVLDPNRSLAYRACCLRSCATVMYSVGLDRDEWIARIRETIGVDLLAVANEEELIVAFQYIDRVRMQAYRARVAVPNAAAFADRDGARFDVWAIVRREGLATVSPRHRESCRRWLDAHDYTVHTLDFSHGIDRAVFASREALEGKQSYSPPRYAFLETLLDDTLEPGCGQVLELLHPEAAREEDPRWWSLLLDVLRERSRWHLAIGARSFAVLYVTHDSPLVGARCATVNLAAPYWTATESGDPFTPPATSHDRAAWDGR